MIEKQIRKLMQAGADGFADIVVDVNAPLPLGCAQTGEVCVIYGKKGRYNDIDFLEFNLLNTLLLKVKSIY